MSIGCVTLSSLWQLHLCSHCLCRHSNRVLSVSELQRMPLLRSAELVAVDAGVRPAAKDAPDEPAGHPVRHEPYRRHDRSKNYRGIMDARSAAGDGGEALAARPQCGLLTGDASGPSPELCRQYLNGATCSN